MPVLLSKLPLPGTKLLISVLMSDVPTPSECDPTPDAVVWLPSACDAVLVA